MLCHFCAKNGTKVISPSSWWVAIPVVRLFPAAPAQTRTQLAQTISIVRTEKDRSIVCRSRKELSPSRVISELHANTGHREAHPTDRTGDMYTDPQHPSTPIGAGQNAQSHMFSLLLCGLMETIKELPEPDRHQLTKNHEASINLFWMPWTGSRNFAGPVRRL